MTFDEYECRHGLPPDQCDACADGQNEGTEALADAIEDEIEDMLG